MNNLPALNEYLTERLRYYNKLVVLTRKDFDDVKKLSDIKDDAFHRIQNLYDGYVLLVDELEKIVKRVNCV